MFSQACVKNSVHGRGRCTPPYVIKYQRHTHNNRGFSFPNKRSKKHNKTRKHSSRMHTARFPSWGGGSAQPPCRQNPPGHVTCDACWEAPHPPSVDKHLRKHYLAFVCGRQKLEKLHRVQKCSKPGTEPDPPPPLEESAPAEDVRVCGLYLLIFDFDEP